MGNGNGKVGWPCPADRQQTGVSKVDGIEGCPVWQLDGRWVPLRVEDTLFTPNGVCARPRIESARGHGQSHPQRRAFDLPAGFLPGRSSLSSSSAPLVTRPAPGFLKRTSVSVMVSPDSA